VIAEIEASAKTVAAAGRFGAGWFKGDAILFGKWRIDQGHTIARNPGALYGRASSGRRSVPTIRFAIVSSFQARPDGAHQPPAGRPREGGLYETRELGPVVVTLALAGCGNPAATGTTILRRGAGSAGPQGATNISVTTAARTIIAAASTTRCGVSRLANGAAQIFPRAGRLRSLGSAYGILQAPAQVEGPLQFAHATLIKVRNSK
jgi:hypothetical protein